MLKVRTDVAEKMFNMMLLFVVFILCPIAFAEADDATTDDAVLQPCETKCGCEEMYIYDAVNDICLINFKTIMKRVVVVYEKNNVEILADDEMAKSIYIEGEKLFKGILISVILFMTCASVCVVSACLYCCRINYTSAYPAYQGCGPARVAEGLKGIPWPWHGQLKEHGDRTLKKNVKALAKKLKRDYNSKKMAPKRAPLPAISESCSVIVEPAGVLVC